MIRFTTLLFTFITLFLVGCAWSPGMKMDVSPDEDELEEEHEVDGHVVNLKIIGPQLFDKYPELSKLSSVAPPKKLFNQFTPEYVLGKYDAVQVIVWDQPGRSQAMGMGLSDNPTGQVITERGTMYYPYAGEIKAAGLTVPELRSLITKKLSHLLQDPQVEVRVLQYRSQKVYVGGAVTNPGAVQLTDTPLSIPDAITAVDGVEKDADGSNVYLNRDGTMYHINIMEMYRSGMPLEKLFLKDGDKINVMSSEENKVYVLGAVNSQSAIPLYHGNLSLSQALMNSGIDQNRANTESVYVIRSVGAGKIDMYHLNAQSPIALVMGENFKLKPRDIVYVDTHGLVQWNSVISLLLPTAAFISTGTSFGQNVNENLFLLRNAIDNETK
ncbi:MAG: polysaccharide biosynthesis/export family protein [Fibrobacterales bacterium]